MALNGSFYGSIVSGHYKLRVDWSATQNVANNTSKITAVLYLVNDWSLAIGGRSDNSASIAGTASTWASPAINGTGTTKLATVTSGNITHNADGTKSVTISATYNIRATINGTYYDKITAEATVTLNTIPRATTPTFHATSVDMGRTLTIYTARASENFTHDLAYSFAGSDWVPFATDVGTWYAWAVPDLATSIPNAISGTMTIRCITKDGSGNTIGTKTALVTVKVPASVVPTIRSVTTEEATAILAGKFEAYVQGYSTVKVTIAADGAKDSTIKSYSATLEGKTYTGSSWTSSVIQGHTTVSLVVTVTDSRGRTTQETKNLAVMGYSKPVISAFSATRRNAAGEADDNGDYLQLYYKYEVESLGGHNSAEVTVEYKHSAGSTWTKLATLTALSADETKFFSTPTFSSDYQYDLRMTVADYFSQSPPFTTILHSGAVILDLKGDGLGISFGKTADKVGADFGWSAKGAVLGLRGATSFIPSDGGDMNDYLTPGVYGFDNAQGGIANCPIKTVGLVRVWTAYGSEQIEGVGSYLMQEVISYLNDTPTYRRAVYSYPTAERTYAAWKETTLNGQKVIWSGTYLMQDGQSIAIPSVSAQSTGIVLVFCRINGTTVQNANFHTFFVPKEVVRNGTSSYGLNFVMATSNFGVVCNKLLFIGDTKISGYVSNNATGTGDSGIKYNNAGFVLRYVLGV